MTSRREIGVVIARRVIGGTWGGVAWRPHGVLAGIPEIAPGTRLGGTAGHELFYASACELSLVPGATAAYRDNLAAGCPSIWVALRADDARQEVICVTADPYEGEALADGFGDIVEAVPMPEPIRGWIAAFVAAFHVERPFVKRRRERWHAIQPRRPRIADGPEVA